MKLTYDFWRDARTDALALSEGAKEVLGLMQTDPTDNGVFVDATGIAARGETQRCTESGEGASGLKGARGQRTPVPVGKRTPVPDKA